MKNEYWHIITKVNEEEKLIKGIKVGNCISLPERRNGRVPLFDFDEGKEVWRYSVKYLGKIDKDVPVKEKIRRIRELKKTKSPSGHN